VIITPPIACAVMIWPRAKFCGKSAA
jgi:hypothetical protein